MKSRRIEQICLIHNYEHILSSQRKYVKKKLSPFFGCVALKQWGTGYPHTLLRMKWVRFLLGLRACYYVPGETP